RFSRDWSSDVCSSDLGAIPLYLTPSRNELGIIGPIPLEEFSRESILAKIDANPLTRGRPARVKLAVITNSTYDGLCYNANLIKQIGRASCRERCIISR